MKLARAPHWEAVWWEACRTYTRWTFELYGICPIKDPMILFFKPAMSRWMGVLLKRWSREAFLEVSPLSPVQLFSLSFKFFFVNYILQSLFLKRFYLFLEGNGGRKRGRQTLIVYLLYALWPGTEPATQACALTGNRTCNPSFCEMMPNWATLVRVILFCISFRCTGLFLFSWLIHNGLETTFRDSYNAKASPRWYTRHWPTLMVCTQLCWSVLMFLLTVAKEVGLPTLPAIWGIGQRVLILALPDCPGPY